MKKSLVFSVLLAVFAGFSFSSCKDKKKDSSCEITSFKVGGEEWLSNGTISKIFCKGTPVNSLTPTITISGVKVEPASGVAQDFSKAVTYTVTAEDGSTKSYTVNVTVNETPCP